MPHSQDETPRLVKVALAELPEWSVERVVGQVIMASIGHDGDDRAFGSGGTDVSIPQAVALKLGGICYFARDDEASTPSAIREQTEALQRTATVPFLVCADQENGLVTRMREPATRIASAMAQTAAGGWEQVANMAEISGLELRSAGINMTASPIADVNNEPENPVIGIRSPSSDPEVVARFDQAVVAGLRRAHVASCAKHFPGHGSTHVDSHVGLPTLEVTEESWWNTEAVPFRACIAAGVDSIMVGHLTAPALDPSGTPATYSRPIVTGLLREKLGFEGVIVTDALDMAGARLGKGYGEETVAALAAGADLALMPAHVTQTHAAVCAAVHEGRLDLGQLRSSAERILRLKLRLAEDAGRLDASDLTAEVAIAHQVAAAAQIEAALTWRDPGVTAQLPKAPARVFILEDDPAPEPKRGVANVGEELAQRLAEVGYEACVESALTWEPGKRAKDFTVLVTRDAWRRSVDAKAIERWARESDVVICARSPYDAALVDEEKPVLLAFGDVPGVAQALASVLISGRARGSLPVDLLDGSGAVRWTRQINADKDGVVEGDQQRESVFGGNAEEAERDR